MNKNFKWVTLDRIKKEHAQYNWLIGQRSNGKTYAVLREALEKWVNSGEQAAYIRRWREDFRGKNGQTIFDALVNDGLVAKLTKNEWTSIYYFSGRWYLCKYVDGKRETQDKPFCYAFSLTNMEHDKSTSYPLITTIIFDEAISRDGYINDEFVLFCNVLSTIIRQRENVTIYMLGNTVNKYCPYFAEMGLTNIKDMNEGDIDVYTYGDSGLRVAVQFTDSITKKGKPSDVYFAFNNPKLQMITGQGSNVWELDIYPHCPIAFDKENIKFIYFIKFNDELLQCEIVQKERDFFTYIHRKTTPLRDTEHDLIYDTQHYSKLNYRRNLLKCVDDIDKKVAWFFKIDKVFYQDNEVGDIVNNYLKWCRQNL